MLYRERNFFLQVSVLVCLGIIGGLVYHNHSTVVKKSNEIEQNIEKKIDDIGIPCPKCPDTKCPDTKCPDTKCPDVVDTGNVSEDKASTTSCPSAQDIAEAVFPGRNTGITQGGKYFDIQSEDSYELLPEYSFFKPERAFPEDSLLDRPLRDANVSVSQNKIDNSIDGNYTDTQRSSSMKGSQTRMDDRTAYQQSIDARMARGISSGPGSDPESSSSYASSSYASASASGPGSLSGYASASAFASASGSGSGSGSGLTVVHSRAPPQKRLVDSSASLDSEYMRDTINKKNIYE